jgi:hypothetical protein
MNAARLPEWCFRLGMIYLVLGMTLGAWMGMTEKFQYRDVHSHFNLLGFVVTFLMGIFLKLYPQALNDTFTRIVVVVCLVTGTIMLGLLAAFYFITPDFGMALGMASFAVWFAYILFAIAVWRATVR